VCQENYLGSTADVKGWQELGLVLGDTFVFHPQKTGAITLSGSILCQDSPTPASVSLYNSAGELLYGPVNATGGSYKLIAPAGEGYTLIISKPGYLRYIVTNISFNDGVVIAAIDLRQLAGDINGDGTVNAVDLACLLSEFNYAPQQYKNADINGDGVVNAVDLTYLLSGFNKQDVVVEW
jgi:hypothetical protein